MDKLVYDNGGEIKKGDIVEYKDGERCEVIEAGILVNSETGEFFGIMLHIRPTGPTVYQYRSYANHAAWMDDNRRKDNGTLAYSTLHLALTSPVSRQWAGYWQRAV